MTACCSMLSRRLGVQLRLQSSRCSRAQPRWRRRGGRGANGRRRLGWWWMRWWWAVWTIRHSPRAVHGTLSIEAQVCVACELPGLECKPRSSLRRSGLICTCANRVLTLTSLIKPRASPSARQEMSAAVTLAWSLDPPERVDYIAQPGVHARRVACTGPTYVAPAAARLALL